MKTDNNTLTIVALIENDPITGVKYGEQKITIGEKQRQKHINRYLSIKARNRQLIDKNRTTHK